jgi:serine/threonine-protein kinase
VKLTSQPRGLPPPIAEAASHANVSAAARNWEPGAAVSRYRLLNRLASGGMAEIWLAAEAGSDQLSNLVVIKRLLEPYSQNADACGMFLDEARIVAQLNHPGIVRLHELGARGDTFFIVMEYVAGATLAAAIHAGVKVGRPIPVPVAVRVVSDAAAAVGHAHVISGLGGEALHIVHRDVSPRNVMLNLSGHTKVVDFGVALATARAPHPTERALVGTVGYMSPEQVRGGEVDARTDVFALGVILFEAATGTRFYEEREMPQIISMLGGAEPLPRAIERNSATPRELSDLIDRALARRPEDRFANGRELHSALEAWLRRRFGKVTASSVEAWLSAVLPEAWDKNARFESAARAWFGVGSPRARASGVHVEVKDPENVETRVLDKPAKRNWRPLLIAVGLLMCALGAAAGAALEPVLRAEPEPAARDRPDPGQPGRTEHRTARRVPEE